MLLVTEPTIDYTAIRAHLDTPRKRVLTWDAQRELLHPHDALEDANWPAPADFASTKALMRRLPHHAQVLCAWIAAEMALLVWEKWADGRAGVDAVAPRRALELVRRWLDGESVAEQEIRDAADAAANAAANAADAAYYAAYSAANANAAAYAANAANAAAYAATVANAAANAATVAYTQQFYTHWWARCRARLAISDIATNQGLT